MVQIKKKNFSKTHTSNTESVNYHIDDSAWCFLCSPWLTANRVERLSNHTDKDYYGSTWLDWLMKHALYSLSTVQLFKAVLFTPSFVVPSSSNQRSVWTWTETKHRGSESITKVNVHDSCPWPLPSWLVNELQTFWMVPSDYCETYRIYNTAERLWATAAVIGQSTTQQQQKKTVSSDYIYHN